MGSLYGILDLPYFLLQKKKGFENSRISFLYFLKNGFFCMLMFKRVKILLPKQVKE